MTQKRTGNFSIGPNFEKRFINDMVKKPDVSLIELVSNAWDAGATEVHINWPIIEGMLNKEIFSIRDNGHGMTEDEFYEYWQELGVDKRKNFGHKVTLDDGSERPIYGRNGKGRLGLFAFSDSYTVSTCKNNVNSIIIVKKAKTAQYAKFETLNTRKLDNDITGTCIKCELTNNYIDIDIVKNVISTRFGANPSFKIFINNNELKLLDIKQFNKHEYEFEGNSIEIIQIPRDQYNKKLTQYQIVWWVHEKGIDTNTWRDLGIPLNPKNPFQNKFVFNVVVDFLENHVKSEGINFDDSEKVKRVKKFVANKITELSSEFIKKSYQKDKYDIIKRSKKELKPLNPITQKDVGTFIDQVLKQTSIGIDDLSKLVTILTTLDRSVHRYNLLNNLAKLSTAQTDQLDEILTNWNVESAYAVLNELYWRLDVIEKLKKLVEDRSADELKQIHPLFDMGLWMFGPEYEGNTNFRSNKTLKTVLAEVLKVKIEKFEGDAKRPDLVTTPDGSIWDIYSTDKLKKGMIVGYKKILIIELKKGGFKIGEEEMNQALKYVSRIKSHGKLQIDTEIICIVLGSTVDQNYKEPLSLGKTAKIYPCTYDTVIRNANLRTFNLIDEIKKVKGISDEGDPEINEVMQEENAQTHH
jgi:hypothetical protein